MKKITLAICIGLIAFSCSNSEENKQTVVESKDTLANVSIVKPPIAGVDIEVEEFAVSAERGDTLFSKSGSIILFPKNAFLDAAGQVVSGDVKVTYREFFDPIDFFVSGIPMNYDSAGVSYDFESAAMCELKATKEGKELFVNPASKPEINMVTTNDSEEFNLYYLNEKKGWESKGKDDLTDLDKKATDKKDSKVAVVNKAMTSTEAPVKPNKVTNPAKTFMIEIAPGAYPELDSYTNIKFEIDASDKTYSEKDTDEEWNEVSISKSTKAGLYNIKFSNAKRKVSYLARPVFDGKDYVAAMKIFDAKMKQYEAARSNRLTNEKEQKDLAEKKLKEEIAANDAKNKSIKEENARIDRMNKLIEARNKEIEAQNKITIAENKKMEEHNNIQRAKQKAYEDMIKNMELKANVMRSFEADGFGIWNCDRPVLKEGILVKAKLIDEKGNPMQYIDITMVSSKFNGVVNYGSGEKISMAKEGKTVLFLISGDEMRYNVTEEFSYDKRGSIVEEEFTFPMKLAPTKINSAQDIRTIVGL